MSKWGWGERVLDRGNSKGKKMCGVMSLTVSKRGRPFPGVNSYSGVTGPKIIDVFMALDIYPALAGLFSKINIYMIMCSVVNSHFPWGVQFRVRQDGKRDFKVSICCMI